MNKQQGIRAKLKSRQQGAVAIIVAVFMLFVAIPLLALVLDLGHLYVTKAKLQNAADAAALSGAKELNNTLDGVDNAVAWAKETYNNNFLEVDYKSGFLPEDVEKIDIGDIYLGSCPDRDRPGSDDTDDCVMISAADINDPADAVGLSFLQVDTGNRTFSTWFAKIWNIFDLQTYGMAVAGRYVTQITPIAVCAMDDSHETQYVSEDGNFPKYLAEWGFRRGTSYNLATVNTAAGVPSGIQPGDSLYVHPTAKTEIECKKDELPETSIIPFLCGGKSTLEGNSGSIVFANTGNMTGKSVDALNTRFNVSSSSCETNPDSDLTLFTPAFADAQWMNYKSDDRTPTQSVITDLGKRLINPSEITSPEFSDIQNEKEAKNGCGGDCGDNYGVLWSNYRPLKKLTADSDTPINAVPSDWSSIYRGGPTYSATTDWASRYTGNGRRIINVLIVNCSAAGGSGVCGAIPVLGVGEFFMQTKVDTSGGTNIYAEFGKLIAQPLPPATQIRLYR